MFDPSMGIGQRSYDLIVNEETGGEAYYNARERHPEWPGGASGVTVGCGFDCGYSTRQEIVDSWGGIIEPSMVLALTSVAGIKGSAARSHAAELRHRVDIPWNSALAVFDKKDIPKWVAIVRSALPNFGELPAECRGVLVSLAFNRGASFRAAGPRYAEMRNIRADMAHQIFDDIPTQLRHMKRLWPAGGDLWRRREHEAALFEAALGHGLAEVQHALNALGYGPIDEDGDLGPQTIEAVKKFQADAGLRADGMPGPLTRAALVAKTTAAAPSPAAPPSSD